MAGGDLKRRLRKGMTTKEALAILRQEFTTETEEIWYFMARLLRAALENQQSVSNQELQVAATALYHGLAIVTTRTGRFRRIPGVQIRPLPRSRRRP